MTGLLFQHAFQKTEYHALLLAFRLFIQNARILLGADAEVNQKRGVAAVVDDLIRSGAVRPGHGAVGALPVFLQRFALPGENRNPPRGHRGGGMILRRKNIAGGPADIRAEFKQRFNQRGGLDCHMQTAHDPHALERFFLSVFPACGHQPRHLLFGDVEFPASEVGKCNVFHLVIGKLFLRLCRRLRLNHDCILVYIAV